MPVNFCANFGVRARTLLNGLPSTARARYWLGLLTLLLTLSGCANVMVDQFYTTPPPTQVVEPTTTAPRITLSPDEGYAGTYITVTGANWPTGARVLLALRDEAGLSDILAVETSDFNGRFDTGFLYPIDERWLNPVPQTVSAYIVDGPDDGETAEVLFTIVPPAGVFVPPTGTPTSTPTSTQTPTATATATSTSTPTRTPTATHTLSPENARIATQIAATRAAFLTSTAQARATEAAAPTQTSTATATATASPTTPATNTPTETATPTITSTVAITEATATVAAVEPTPTATPAPTETAEPQLQQPQVLLVNQWRGDYWANPTLSGEPTLIRNDESIDFNWGTGSPDGAIPADNFSARWTRALDFSPGGYRFILEVDDGARLYVDNELLIDNFVDGPARTLTAERTLSGGLHSIRVEYYERAEQASIRFRFERSDG